MPVARLEESQEPTGPRRRNTGPWEGNWHGPLICHAFEEGRLQKEVLGCSDARLRRKHLLLSQNHLVVTMVATGCSVS